MKHFMATEAKNRFGELMDVSGNEPVMIDKNGTAHRVLLPVEEYRRLTRDTLDEWLRVNTAPA